jgi:hypothetical protein
MKGGILLGFLTLVLLFGCTVQEPPAPEPKLQHICPDGSTIVTDLNDCPKIDQELKECEEATATSSYGYSDRDVCYYDLALDRENVSLCRKIRTTSSYYSYTAAKCGAELAIYLDDYTLCDNLSITAKYDCYAVLSEELDDPSMCEYITSIPKRDDCLYSYLLSNSYYIDDWSVCDKFSNRSSEASYCYYKAATDTGDYKYCNKITRSGGGYYSYSKPTCYGAVAKDKKKPSVCEQLSDSVDEDDCYYHYATTYPYDMEVCNKINDSSYKGTCISLTNRTYSYYY